MSMVKDADTPGTTRAGTEVSGRAVVGSDDDGAITMAAAELRAGRAVVGSDDDGAITMAAAELRAGRAVVGSDDDGAITMAAAELRAGRAVVGSDDDGAITMAAAELRAGRAVVIPTDTVYGLAVLPENLGLLFELKQRPPDKAVAVLVARAADVEELFDPLPATRRLMEEFWPGALTIVQNGWGTRCPDHPLVRALATEVGPIATSSANLSGQPTPDTAAEAADTFKTVNLVIDGGRCQSPPSTVVEIAETGITVLREGAISAKTVRVVTGGG